MATNCFQQCWKGEGLDCTEQIDTAVLIAPPRTAKGHQPQQDTGASLFLSGWRLQLPSLLLTAGEDGFNIPSEVTTLGIIGYKFPEESSSLLNDSLIHNSQGRKTAESERKYFLKEYISLLLLCATSIKSYAQSFHSCLRKVRVLMWWKRVRQGLSMSPDISF